MADKAKSFALSLLAQCDIPVNTSDAHSLRVHDERLWNRVISQRQLGLGEAYMDGWWDCDCIDEMLTRIIVGGADAAVKKGPKLAAPCDQVMAVEQADTEQSQAKCTTPLRHR